MRIIAARALAIAVMLLVLGVERWLDRLGMPLLIEGCLVAAFAATAVVRIRSLVNSIAVPYSPPERLASTGECMS